jgi:hypothetical protein
MARPSQKSKADKVRIVLAVLRGEVTIARRPGGSRRRRRRWRSGGTSSWPAASRRSRKGPAMVLTGGNRPWRPRSSS